MQGKCRNRSEAREGRSGVSDVEKKAIPERNISIATKMRAFEEEHHYDGAI